MANLHGSLIQKTGRSNYRNLEKISSNSITLKAHKNGLSKQHITFSEEIAKGTYLVGFNRDFDFLPGQILGIALQDDGPKRLYSICSGANDDEVKILYNVIDDGFLTPQLSDLEIGDAIWISEPRGKFLDDASPAMWIATGTGIAPYYSMMRSGLSEDKLLLHGERYLEKFYFYDEFSDQLGSNYIRCCSAESDESSFDGRVTDYLRETNDLSPEMKYYLCGRAEMVVEARDILIEKGIPFDHIISEIYF